MKTITINALKELKENKEKFACISAYDASLAKLVTQAEIDTLLVGDSLGMVMQGKESTIPVTMEDMVYHTQAVSRGANGTFVIADMPFGSYNSDTQALDNASQLMAAGAHAVKLEGGDWLCPMVNEMVQRGIPVCGHLDSPLNPLTN